MQIVHIVPGSGGNFYCGNCLRDSKYVHELRALNHEVVKVPMYLPIFRDEHDLEDVPVFYGAISIYLKQFYPVFERFPGWIDRLLNSRPALKLASGMAGTTRAQGLEEMTLSMLMGENGKQAEELDKMVSWIQQHLKPDIIHLSNALLLGLSHHLKEKLNVPLVCSLQDEHVWVDNMHPSFQKKAWILMGEKKAYIDSFISVSDYYLTLMREKLNLSNDKLQRLHLGVDPADYNFRLATDKPRNIGYISRMCYENGLDILIDAFIELKKNPGTEEVKLILTGGHTRDDRMFLREQKSKLHQAGLRHCVKFHENFTTEGRKDFFDKVSVVSVPVRGGEAFGLYLLEAQVSGTPVVQPRLGAFPEIIAKGGGGIIYEPNNAGKLSVALMDLLFDPDQLRRLSNAGREGVLQHFHINVQSSRMLEMYNNLIK